jgi:intracellular multiplication protein IcmL
MATAPTSTAPLRTSPDAAMRRPVKGAPPEVMDEKTAKARFVRLRMIVIIQTWLIAVLGIALVVELPFAQPVYLYYARMPDDKVMRMVGLDVPNMTNRAVLSWATTGITEIMTMGFGDMDAKLAKQKIRFTEAGWKAYNKAFVNLKVGETFKQNQLVLTTVPSNTPVILAQGANADDVYQWVVQMPVVMTYATNNNVTRKERGFVTLTVVRVPAAESSAGIAIQSWQLYN